MSEAEPDPNAPGPYQGRIDALERAIFRARVRHPVAFGVVLLAGATFWIEAVLAGVFPAFFAAPALAWAAVLALGSVATAAGARWALEAPARLVLQGRGAEGAELAERAAAGAATPATAGLLLTWAASFWQGAGDPGRAKRALGKLTEHEEVHGLPAGLAVHAHHARAHVALATGDTVAARVYAEAGLAAAPEDPELAGELVLFRDWAGLMGEDPRPMLARLEAPPEDGEGAAARAARVLMGTLAARQVGRLDLVAAGCEDLEPAVLGGSGSAFYLSCLFLMDLAILDLAPQVEILRDRLAAMDGVAGVLPFWVELPRALVAGDGPAVQAAYEAGLPAAGASPELEGLWAAFRAFGALAAGDEPGADALLRAAPDVETITYQISLGAMALNHGGHAEVVLAAVRRARATRDDWSGEAEEELLGEVARARLITGDLPGARAAVTRLADLHALDPRRLFDVRVLELFVSAAEGAAPADLVPRARALHRERPWDPSGRYALASFLLEAGATDAEPHELLACYDSWAPAQFAAPGRVATLRHLARAAGLAGDDAAATRRRAELADLPGGAAAPGSLPGPGGAGD